MVVLTTFEKTLLDTAPLPDSLNPAECPEEQRPLAPLLPTPVGFYALAAALAAASWRTRAARLRALRRSRRRPGR